MKAVTSVRLNKSPSLAYLKGEPRVDVSLGCFLLLSLACHSPVITRTSTALLSPQEKNTTIITPRKNKHKIHYIGTENYECYHSISKQVPKVNYQELLHLKDKQHYSCLNKPELYYYSTSRTKP